MDAITASPLQRASSNALVTLSCREPLLSDMAGQCKGLRSRPIMVFNSARRVIAIKGGNGAQARHGCQLLRWQGLTQWPSRKKLVSRSLSAAENERVVVAVEESRDGSVVFKYGSSDERPSQDPLEAFVKGIAAEEAKQEKENCVTESSASTTENDPGISPVEVKTLNASAENVLGEVGNGLSGSVNGEADVRATEIEAPKAIAEDEVKQTPVNSGRTGSETVDVTGRRQGSLSSNEQTAQPPVIKGESAQAEAVEGDYAQAEAVEGETAKAETVQGESAQAEAVKGEPARAEAVKGKSAQAQEPFDQAQAVKGESAQAGQNDSEQMSNSIAAEGEKAVQGVSGIEEQPEPVSMGKTTEEPQTAQSASSEKAAAVVQALKFQAGAAVLPHPAKVDKGGEDAYFIHKHGLSLGVADGVGGWAMLGVDSGLYSRQLMFQCNRLAEEYEDPTTVIARAHALVQAVGSSTVLVAKLDGEKLTVANLGDSGFLLVRDGQLKLASQQMQHAFNFPYQIGSQGQDQPKDAQTYTCDVKLGDVLVLGTDGLFDNVFEKEITDKVWKFCKDGADAQGAAKKLANLAQDWAGRKKGMTPFAAAAQAAKYRYEGGKMDDITVVVAYVEEARKR